MIQIQESVWPKESLLLHLVPAVLAKLALPVEPHYGDEFVKL